MRAADDDASVSSLHADLFRFELNDIERHAKVVVVVEKLGGKPIGPLLRSTG